ncbi:hypothetical protein LPJ61_000891 [Coemansia biformis]|uniref:Uncharacterized protein n=1 Tax=Coemansia biformis TaxID=1286918 RepID=A0A9W7YH24_9FUNG|nr:hypothetical protein LPJ61_000891 [Coemansia biformis]
MLSRCVQHVRLSLYASTTCSLARRLAQCVVPPEIALTRHTLERWSLRSCYRLNARIGRLSTQDKTPGSGAGAAGPVDSAEPDNTRIPQPKAPAAATGSPQPLISNDLSRSPNASEREPTEHVDSDGNDQYSRIQGMIDALIKDANSALNSTPRSHHHDLHMPDSPADVERASERSESASSGPDETPTLVGDLGAECTLAAVFAAKPRPVTPRPAPHIREFTRHTPGLRPSSARGTLPTAPHSWRLSPRPSSRATRHWAEPLHDPSEADAESDSECGTFGVSLAGQQSYRRRRRSSERLGDWHFGTARPLERYRADTGDSLPSNSSETCVSPGNRLSREFQPVPLVLPPYGLYDSSVGVGASRLQTTMAGHAYAFPHLSRDGRHSDRHYEHTQAEHHRGMCSSVDYAVLQGHQHGAGDMYVPPTHSMRTRSSTHSGDSSPVGLTHADMYDRGPPFGHPAGTGRSRYVRREAPWLKDDCALASSMPPQLDLNCRPAGATAGERSAVTWQIGARLDSPQPVTQSPSLSWRPASERPCQAPAASSTSRDRALSSADKPECSGGASMAAGSNESGLLNMFSLVYWTVLFTLGALMLDSFLCHAAGKRVMGTVDKITNTEMPDADQSHDDRQASKNKEPACDEHCGTVDLAGAVGRFVRWYVESPEDAPGSSGTSTQALRPRSLRARKTSAARGSFIYID